MPMPQTASGAAVATHVPAIVPAGAYVYQPQAGGSQRGWPGQPAAAGASRVPAQSIFQSQGQLQLQPHETNAALQQPSSSARAPAARPTDRSSESPPVLPARDVPLQAPAGHQQTRTPQPQAAATGAYRQRSDAAQVSVRSRLFIRTRRSND